MTSTQTSAIIIDHIENGQREIYDTEETELMDHNRKEIQPKSYFLQK
jgi:hypothetical protein